LKQFLKLALWLTLLSTIASFAQSQAAAPEVDQRAIGTLSRAQKAVGGLHRLQAIRDVTRAVEMLNLAADGRARATWQIIFPNVLCLTTDSPLGEITAFSNGQAGWVSSGMGVDDHLPDWQIRAAPQDLFRQIESLLQSDRDPDKKLEFIEHGQVDARPASVLQVTSLAAGIIRLWIDDASGDLLKIEYRRVVARGTGPLVTDFFSDYRWVKKTLRIPFYIHTLSDGQPYMDMRILRVEYNRGLQAETLGQKPQPK
jgi:hypothetical protein